jgi:hypothetical protein
MQGDFEMQFQLNQATEVLRSTPGVLTALLEGKSAAWLNARRSPEAFSAIDVLGHLMHAELTDWIPRVRVILEQGTAQPFTPFDRFDFRHLIAGKSVGELLTEFETLRRQSLETLHQLNLDPVHFALLGTHPDLGVVTLGNLLATWAVHDLGHISQIVGTMANEYREAVGPWRVYTTILHRA